MPQKLPSIRACGCVLRQGETCIHRQAAKAEADRRRPTARKRGYDSAWDKARAAFLEHHPFCVRCGEPGTVVDHIKPHRGDMQLFWDWTNWQTLCAACHRSWKQSLERK